jgi:dihydrofolate reductase
MAKVIVTEFLTLDGVMQAPGGPDEDREGGFEHGGWIMPLFDEAMGKAVNDVTERTGGYLLGRKTYEIFAAYWPTAPAEEPLADTINKLPKYVASTTLKDPLEWNNSWLVKGDVAGEVARLKRDTEKDLQVVGSGELVQTLIRSGLVDEYLLMVSPIVVGTGKRLFREGLPRTGLRLVGSTASSTGVVIATYAPDRSEGKG